MLLAGHIKPWKDSTPRERLDPSNGLAACPAHDVAFDTGLLTVNGGLRIHLAPTLADAVRADPLTRQYYGPPAPARHADPPAGHTATRPQVPRLAPPENLPHLTAPPTAANRSAWPCGLTAATARPAAGDDAAAIIPGHGRPASPPATAGGGRYTGQVSQPLAEPPHLPPATHEQVRARAAQLVSLAAQHGITALAFASPGRLRGHVADDRDLFDMFEFQRAATELLGADVTLFSDGALRNNHVSPDLVTASPL